MWVKYSNQPTICFRCKSLGRIAKNCTGEELPKRNVNINSHESTTIEAPIKQRQDKEKVMNKTHRSIFVNDGTESELKNSSISKNYTGSDIEKDLKEWDKFIKEKSDLKRGRLENKSQSSTDTSPSYKKKAMDNDDVFLTPDLAWTEAMGLSSSTEADYTNSASRIYCKICQKPMKQG